MIELYRTADCPGCEAIEEALQEMVLAYRVVVVQPDQWPDHLDPRTPLPALNDNGELISGLVAITGYLVELEKIVEEWRKYQADACYIHEDDEVC